MILWLNGPFGVGKTATAQCIVAAHAGWRLFDPETVGYMLKANLRDHDIADFQDLDAWRALVPRVAAELNTLTRTDLVAVQTVLVERYWSDLRAGAAFLGVDIFHVLLDCREDVLRGRIHADDVERGARDWRLDHLAVYEAARPWLIRAADIVLDTSALNCDQVAEQVLAALP
jgi:hypothetical protein